MIGLDEVGFSEAIIRKQSLELAKQSARIVELEDKLKVREWEHTKEAQDAMKGMHKRVVDLQAQADRYFAIVKELEELNRTMSQENEELKAQSDKYFVMVRELGLRITDLRGKVDKWKARAKARKHK